MPGNIEPATEANGPTSHRDETSVVVIFFDDMKGSTALKEHMAEKWDEQAFQKLRKEHDALLTAIITRDRAGEVIKSTGDGLLAIFYKPSTAVERAIEIQEKLHAHPHLSVRIGMDMGEVRVESVGPTKQDAFGRHVDWAARAMELAEGGHICVTRSVYTDAFSWITKSRIAWKEYGLHRVKSGEPPLEIFEPYNANIAKPMDSLRGEKVAAGTGHPQPRPDQTSPMSQPGVGQQQLRLARSWESVARDGRDFAEHGAGMMYWFKVPLGGICYPEGFRNFLQPALANPKIPKIRFVLDSSVPIIRQIFISGWFAHDLSNFHRPRTTPHPNDEEKRNEVEGEVQPDERKDVSENPLRVFGDTEGVVLVHFDDMFYNVVSLEPHPRCQGQRHAARRVLATPQKEQDDSDL